MPETYATLLKLTSVAGRYAVVLRFTSQVSFPYSFSVLVSELNNNGKIQLLSCLSYFDIRFD